MADKKYIVSLEIDNSGAIANTEEVAGQLDKVTNGATSARTELRKLQQQLSQTAEGSDEFQKLSKQAGELKDRIDDAAKAARANAGSAFEVLRNNTVNLKDSLLNLDFEGLNSSLKGIGGAVGNIKFSDLGNAAKSLGSTLASVGKALLTNPLFLLLTGAALLIANFEKVTKLFDGVTDAQEKQLEIQKQQAVAAKEQLDAISEQENILKLQGKTEKEILELKKKAVDAAIIEQRAAIETQQVILQGQLEAAKRNRNVLDGILNFLSAPLRLILKSVDLIGSAFGQDFGALKAFDDIKNSLAGTVFDPEAVKAEGEAALKEQRKTLTALENQKAGFELQSIKSAKDASDERKKLAEEEAERQLKLAQEFQKQLTEIFIKTAEINKKIRASLQSETENTTLITGNEDRFTKLKEQADIELELVKSNKEREKEAEIQAADDKYIALRARAQGNADLLKQIAEANRREVAEIEKKYDDEELKRQQELRDAKIALAATAVQGLISIVQDLNVKNEKQARNQFAVGKALAIADTLIKTYQAAQGAYAAQLAVPGVGAPFRAAAAAAIAIASGLARVNAIRKQRFGDSGSSFASTPAAAPAATTPQAQGAPAFNPVNTNFIGNRPPQATPAYVTAKDIINGVEGYETVKRQARL